MKLTDKRTRIAKEFARLAELEKQSKALENEIQSAKQYIIDYMTANGEDNLESHV